VGEDVEISLYYGDCIEVMKGIPNKSVECCVTDIPYGECNRDSNGLRNLDKGKADVVTFPLKEMLSELNRIIRGSVYIFCGTEQVSEIRKTLVENGFSTRLLIWEKTNPSPMNGKTIWLSGIECCVYGKRPRATYNGHCQNTVLRYPCGRNKLHPTQKPIELITKLVETSTNENDTVIDVCMGSGTTGVACVNTGRNFIGIELDEQYFKTAQDRINKAKSDWLDNLLGGVEC
jgi:DNA modification methylase